MPTRSRELNAESTSTCMTVPRVWFLGILATLFQKREVSEAIYDSA